MPEEVKTPEVKKEEPPEGMVEEVVEAAEECPGECIFIDVQS